MAGKKWCEYCRININYSKKDIQAHEATRLHLQNKQRQIKFERIKIQNQKKQATKHEPILSTANIPKAKKGSELQKQVQQYRDSVINQGKSAIHMLIAQRTQGLYGAPIQFPDKEDLVLAQNYEQQKPVGQQSEESQGQDNFQMWKVDICDSTGDPCFINRITKAVIYQPPKGYLLSQSQKQQWQYLQELCKQKVQFDPDKQVIITQWEQVPDEQNYFTVNKVQSSEQQELVREDNSANKKQVNQEFLQKYLVKKQQNLTQQKTGHKNINHHAQAIVYIKRQFQDQQQQKQPNFQNFKNVKQKNQAFKKLIEHGIQIRATRPTDQLIQENDDQPSSFKGFKARKKVKTTEISILNNEADIQ